MNNATFYSFYNSCLEEEFKYLFILRRDSLDDYVLIENIKQEMYNSKWDKEHCIIGEPQDPSFPIIEFNDNSIKFIERTSDNYSLNALSFHLDSMKI